MTCCCPLRNLSPLDGCHPVLFWSCGMECTEPVALLSRNRRLSTGALHGHTQNAPRSHNRRAHTESLEAPEGRVFDAGWRRAWPDWQCRHHGQRRQLARLNYSCQSTARIVPASSPIRLSPPSASSTSTGDSRARRASSLMLGTASPCQLRTCSSSHPCSGLSKPARSRTS